MGSNVGPLHSEYRVLATGPPEKSQGAEFKGKWSQIFNITFTNFREFCDKKNVYIFAYLFLIYLNLIVIHLGCFFISKGNAKECSNYCTIALILHASKVMLRILQARLQQYVNHELLDVQAGFIKGRGSRDQIANILCIIKKQDGSRKKSISALPTMPKPLTVLITINCGKFFKRWEYQNT